MTTAVPSKEYLASRLRTVHAGPRRDLELSRHVFQGVPAYILRDVVTGDNDTLSVADYQVFSALDERRTLGDSFVQLCSQGLLTSADEGSFYGFVLDLHQRGLLTLPVSDGQQLYQRHERRRAAQNAGRLMNVLFQRVPLLRPDAFLTRTQHWFAPLFTRTAFFVWLAAMGLAVCVVCQRWFAFQDRIANLFDVNNWPLLVGLLLALKTCHEFGHAYACKHFGGRVPEMGAYFILLTPCAYVDASAAWGFRSRRQRIIVSLAGMYFESLVALPALAVWCLTEPSPFHAAAQFVVVLSTIVTVAVNLNPLVRYDGYFVLCDLAAVPNLSEQANKRVLQVAKRVLYGVSPTSDSDTSMLRWLLPIYGLASVCYRACFLVGMVALLSIKIPLAGMALGVVFLWNVGRRNLRRLMSYLRHDPQIADRRLRAMLVTGSLMLSLPTLVLMAPWPRSVTAIGVVAREDDRPLRATTPGFLREWFVRPGDDLPVDTPICRLENPLLVAEVRAKQAEVRRLIVARDAALAADVLAAADLEQRLRQAKRATAAAEHRVDELIIRAPAAGHVSGSETMRQTGQFVASGTPVAMLHGGARIVRTLVAAELFADHVPRLGDNVEVMPTGAEGSICRGRILRVAAAGSRTIREQSLTQIGGGDIAVDPRTHEATNAVFEVTVALDAGPSVSLSDQATAVVRFHAPTVRVVTLLHRKWLRFVNQLRAGS